MDITIMVKIRDYPDSPYMESLNVADLLPYIEKVDRTDISIRAHGSFWHKAWIHLGCYNPPVRDMYGFRQRMETEHGLENFGR